MTAGVVDTWVSMTVNGLLVVIYAFTLYKACKGTRYKMVMGQIVMLLVASFCYIIYNFFDDFVNPWCIENGCSQKFTVTELGIAAFTMGIADLLFGEAHWLLAYNYFKLAKNQPRQIAGATEQVQEYKRMLWVGVVFNFVMPLLEMFFGFYRVVNETLFLDNFYTAIKSITEGLWIVSGIILIWSVNAIRVSMNSQESSGKAVNVTNLVIHSSAFALFALSVVINLYSYVKMAIVWGNATNQARMDRALL